MSLLLTLNGLNADQKSAVNDGSKFGKEACARNGKVNHEALISELTPLDQKGKSFDGKSAKQNMEKQQFQQNASSELLKDPAILRYYDFKPDDKSIQHSDKIIDSYANGTIEQDESEGEWKIEKCLEQGVPYALEVAYSLNVQVKKIPEVKITYHECNGHEKYINWSIDPQRLIKKENKKLASDPSIKNFSVEMLTNALKIRSHWTHHDDAASCSNHSLKEKVLTPSRLEFEDKWTVDKPKNLTLAQTSNCTFTKSDSIKPGTKTIDGVKVSRESWKKIETYMCRYDQQKCPFFGSYNCIQKGKECKKKYHDQCALWEITFKCRVGNNGKVGINTQETFGTEKNLWETSYNPNTSFAEATTKLKIFDEMKNQLENSTSSNIFEIQLFGGKKSQCSKSVAKDLFYDCCFSFKGLAKDLKLSKCNADEMALAEMKDKGLCHYVGSYKEKILNVTTRTEHVYCCFTTKLARVLNEEGRKQLKMDWGSAKKPNCRGFTQNEIQNLDFSKIDLSEAYDAPPSIDMENKIQIIQERLQKRLENFEGSK